MFARTERLLLRPGWLEDAPALARIASDEAVARNLTRLPSPYGMADAEAFLASQAEQSCPPLLIFRRTDADPELIGSIGFGCGTDGEREFGYWIARAHWGRGYATEAGRAVIDIARKGLRLPKLSAGHFTDNPASGRVLEKLGFCPIGRIAARYSAGRGAAAPCKLFEFDLTAEAKTEAKEAPVRETMAACA